jgi:hypothetical protein
MIVVLREREISLCLEKGNERELLLIRVKLIKHNANSFVFIESIQANSHACGRAKEQACFVCQEKSSVKVQVEIIKHEHNGNKPRPAKVRTSLTFALHFHSPVLIEREK